MIQEAVIVSTARTPIGKAYRGAFNNTYGATLSGHAVKHAVSRSGLEYGEIEIKRGGHFSGTVRNTKEHNESPSLEAPNISAAE